jgi:PKD repeat protein
VASTTTLPVTIAEPAGNVAPTASVSPPNCAGLVCNFSGLTSTDPNVGDALTYTWDFGDATTPSTSSGPSHTYLTAGTYPVTLTVRDGWGKSSTATVSVTVG